LIFPGIPKLQSGGAGIVLMGVGTILSSMILAGFLLGYLVDAWLDSRPMFMLVFAGLGAVGGFLKVYKLLSRNG
jgi:ATP synthase protein I